MGHCSTVYGYARVSTSEQNLGRQMASLIDAGVEEGNIFYEKVSGAKRSRPMLDSLLSVLEEGDTVVVASFDRLARSTCQLIELSERFCEQGVHLRSLKEQVDTSTPQGKLFFTISAAFAEFERNVIRERQREGIAIAKAKGVYDRPRTHEPSENTLRTLANLHDTGQITATRAAEVLGMSRRTYARARERILA